MECDDKSCLRVKSGFRHPGNYNTHINWSVFCTKPIEKKPGPNLIQFQFATPEMIKDFFMFTASNNQQQQVMNLRILR